MIHCRAVSNCPTCINVQWLRILGCSECLFYRNYNQERSLFYWDVKKKSRLIAWNTVPVWSTEAYCRQQLLKMQVKHNTYHWGIQLNCKVMQVKKVTFQRVGSVCIAHPSKQRKHFDSKQFVECMFHTPAFILLCNPWGRIYQTQLSAVCYSPYASQTEP